MSNSCSECGKSPGALFWVEKRYLCGACLERMFPEETLRAMFPMRKSQAEQEALNKRVDEKMWLRMVDLPGYAEWAASYRGLDRIIPKLPEHHVLVHPDEMQRSLVWLFEREFQGWLDDYADRGAPRKRLSEYEVAQPEAETIDKEAQP